MKKLSIYIGWCGRVGKAIALDAKGVGIKSQRSTNIFKNHYEYFSTTLSQVCIRHDELGYNRGSRFNRKIVTAKELCQVSLLRITLAGKAMTKTRNDPL